MSEQESFLSDQSSIDNPYTKSVSSTSPKKNPLKNTFKDEVEQQQELNAFEHAMHHPTEIQSEVIKITPPVAAESSQYNINSSSSNSTSIKSDEFKYYQDTYYPDYEKAEMMTQSSKESENGNNEKGSSNFVKSVNQK